jgi:hypothetical protein
MRITKVSVSRKFNLGNYESCDMAAEAELNENDKPLEIWEILRDNIEMEFAAMQRKDRKAPTPASDQSIIRAKPAGPEPPTPQPTELFKPATIKNVLAQLDGSMKPIHYIEDKELFAQINSDLRSHGYEWLSAGKESRWVKQ